MSGRARPSSGGRGLTACPKGHKSDSSAQFCSTCGLPLDLGDDKRGPMMTRVKPSSRAKVQLLANQLADGHKGEVVEEITDFASEIVNGKASPEQVRELMAFFVKLGEKAWPIILKENADVGYAVRKAAKELGEEKKS